MDKLASCVIELTVGFLWMCAMVYMMFLGLKIMVMLAPFVIHISIIVGIIIACL